MTGRARSCPNCGGEIEFRAGTSLLTVCPYCASAVARVGDDVDRLVVLGLVAPLAEVGSMLAIGLSGRHQGRGFTLVGCLQLDYGAGPWNEWYAAFDDGTWGWVAEAQGKVYLTRPRPAQGLPRHDRIVLGRPFRGGGVVLKAVERREATFVGAAGELPIRAAPGESFRYVDVEGPGGVFGTIEYGPDEEATDFFLGTALRYEDLFAGRDLSERSRPAGGWAAPSAAIGLNCPSCGAGVRLRAPDHTQRVACDACGALLDCRPGQPLFLLSAAVRRGPEPRIRLGSKGRFGQRELTVFGHLVRGVEVEGVHYTWEEYLLHEARLGWRWLVASQGHYTLVEPVHAGEVESLDSREQYVRHAGDRYRLFQSSWARVEAIRGEFYWKVEVGETVRTKEYVSPPHMLSMEATDEEVVWSKGTYLEPREVERAFGLDKRLPRPSGIAPCQPNPHRATRRSVFRSALALTGLLVIVVLGFVLAADNRLVVEAEVDLTRLQKSRQAAAQKFTAEPMSTAPFTLRGPANLAIEVESNLDNSWLYLGGWLENQTLDERRPFGAEASFYQGVSDGETWQEGSRTRTVHLGEVASGEYVLRFVPEWSAARPPTYFRLRVRSDVFVGSHVLGAAALLWLFPVLVTMRHFSFEKKRWAESDHGSD